MNKQKIVLVTGSSKGIGLAIAKRFNEAKWLVIQNSRNYVADAQIGETLIKADVTKIDQVISLLNQIKVKYGRLDAIVCNVGSGKNLDSCNPQERWSHFLEKNLLSAVIVVDNALSLFKISSITLISSVCGNSVVLDAPVEYSTAKAALNQYVKVMAKKHAQSQIRINLVSPGNVIFNGSIWDEKLKLDDINTIDYIKRNVPMGKFIETQDITEMVYYLASDKNRFITGQNIIIDGGQSL